jgi:DNA-binding NarL/FixJ family response regulator
MSEVSLASTTLLLADNSTPMRSAVIKVLNRIDGLCVVGEASEYSRMLALAASLKPDIVLMDLHMDDEGQFSPETVREQLGTLTKHILVMSVWNDPDTKALASRYGATTLLDKANLVSELAETISALA